MDIKKIVGNRINEALAQNEMLQKDLAKVLGVTDNTISYFCKGSRSPQLEQLPKIAAALNTTTDYLLGITQVKSPSIDTQAIVSKTGLSEENVEHLEYFHSFPMEAHLNMANVFLSFILDSKLSMDYLLMETTLNIPSVDSTPLDSDEFVEQAIAVGKQRTRGYVQLTGEDAFLFYCSKIADRFEQLLIDKYKSTAKWEASHGND